MSGDTSELRALAVDLGKVASSVLDDVDAVVKKAAQNVKDGLIEDARGSVYFDQLARSVTYDRAYRVGAVEYEVGPDRDRAPAAGLAGAYYGWPNGGGASLSLDRPVDEEEPRMMAHLDRILGGLL